MTNRVFLLKSDSGRQRKLSAALRQCTGNTLPPRDITAITRRIRHDRQYSIYVYHDPKAFAQALVLVRRGPRYDYGKVILGEACFGISGHERGTCGRLLTARHITAAQIIRHFRDRAEYRALHIYIPEQIGQEGCTHAERR